MGRPPKAGAAVLPTVEVPVHPLEDATAADESDDELHAQTTPVRRLVASQLERLTPRGRLRSQEEREELLFTPEAQATLPPPL